MAEYTDKQLDEFALAYYLRKEKRSRSILFDEYLFFGSKDYYSEVLDSFYLYRKENGIEDPANWNTIPFENNPIFKKSLEKIETQFKDVDLVETSKTLRDLHAAKEWKDPLEHPEILLEEKEPTKEKKKGEEIDGSSADDEMDGDIEEELEKDGNTAAQNSPPPSGTSPLGTTSESKKKAETEDQKKEEEPLQWLTDLLTPSDKKKDEKKDEKTSIDLNLKKIFSTENLLKYGLDIEISEDAPTLSAEEEEIAERRSALNLKLKSVLDLYDNGPQIYKKIETREEKETKENKTLREFFNTAFTKSRPIKISLDTADLKIKKNSPKIKARAKTRGERMGALDVLNQVELQLSRNNGLSLWVSKNGWMNKRGKPKKAENFSDNDYYHLTLSYALAKEMGKEVSNKGQVEQALKGAPDEIKEKLAADVKEALEGLLPEIQRRAEKYPDRKITSIFKDLHSPKEEKPKKEPVVEEGKKPKEREPVVVEEKETTTKPPAGEPSTVTKKRVFDKDDIDLQAEYFFLMGVTHNENEWEKRRELMGKDRIGEGDEFPLYDALAEKGIFADFAKRSSMLEIRESGKHMDFIAAYERAVEKYRDKFPEFETETENAVVDEQHASEPEFNPDNIALQAEYIYLMHARPGEHEARLELMGTDPAQESALWHAIHDQHGISADPAHGTTLESLEQNHPALHKAIKQAHIKYGPPALIVTSENIVQEEQDGDAEVFPHVIEGFSGSPEQLQEQADDEKLMLLNTLKNVKDLFEELGSSHEKNTVKPAAEQYIPDEIDGFGGSDPIEYASDKIESPQRFDKKDLYDPNQYLSMTNLDMFSAPTVGAADFHSTSNASEIDRFSDILPQPEKKEEEEEEKADPMITTDKNDKTQMDHAALDSLHLNDLPVPVEQPGSEGALSKLTLSDEFRKTSQSNNEEIWSSQNGQSRIIKAYNEKTHKLETIIYDDGQEAVHVVLREDESIEKILQEKEEKIIMRDLFDKKGILKRSYAIPADKKDLILRLSAKLDPYGHVKRPKDSFNEYKKHYRDYTLKKINHILSHEDTPDVNQDNIPENQ